MSGDRQVVIEAVKIRKTYRRGVEEIAAVDGLDITVRAGEYLAVVGPSGSGKTTLLNILGCLDNPTSGTLRIGGRTVFEGGKGLSEGRLTRLRREVFGYVFQNFHLVPTLTVMENVLVPYVFFRKTGDGRTGPRNTGFPGPREAPGPPAGGAFGGRDAESGPGQGPCQLSRRPAGRRTNREPRQQAERRDRRDIQGA